MNTGPKNKRNGAAWEIKLRDYLRKRGIKCERLRLSGTKDEGDIAIVDPSIPFPIVIEAKAPGPGNPIRLSEWVREAVDEATHYAQARNLDDSALPIVVIKAPNKPVDQAYVVMRLCDFLEESR